jgi:ABC-type lipoprotein release transport system permease subunit
MIISIAWKNVWRNKARSMVVIVSVTLGTIAGVFVAGLMNGWLNQRINSAIYTENGHLKIQNPNFLINEESQFSIQNFDKIIQYLDNSTEVKAYAKRSKIMALATTARGSSGIMLKGIDPEKEKLVSDVFEYLEPDGGNYFDTDTKLPSVVIGSKTAEALRIKNFLVSQQTLDSLQSLEIPIASINKLEAIKEQRFITKKKFETAIKEVWTEKELRKYSPTLIKVSSYFQPRAKINFTFTKTNGEIGYQTYQVCGIFKTSNTVFDQMSAFVNHSHLAEVAGLDSNQFHEISIILNEEQTNLKTFTTKLSSAFNEQSVMTWKVLAPDAGMMADFMTIYYYIIMGIIFFALAFGIINTMLMAILERIKELGMLMAIGMNKVKVFSMIMFETVFLTLTGSVLGMVIGAILIAITGHTGLNFSSVEEGFEAMGWSAKVYPAIDTAFFMGVTIMVIAIAMLASIVPARKALKLKPVDALRSE